MTKGPLDGIRVVDLTRTCSGPICGRVLADLIKVEPPAGDLTRPVPPVDDNDIGPQIDQLITQGAVQIPDWLADSVDLKAVN